MVREVGIPESVRSLGEQALKYWFFDMWPIENPRV